MENISVLIRGCIAKEYRSQKIVYENYRAFALKIVFRYVYRYDKAVDLVNDCFVKLFKKFDRFRAAESEEENRKLLMGYIKRILINAAIDELRRGNLPQETGGIPDHAWDLSGKGDEADQKLRYKELIVMVKELPPQYRIVFNMYVIDGFNHVEISEALQIPVGSSKSNLSRAKKCFKQTSGIRKKKSMQYSDDDMEEAFREAASNYPVKMEDEGWELIAGKLSNTAIPGTIAGSLTKPKLALRSVVFLMAGFLICGTGGFIISQWKAGNIKKSIVKENSTGLLKSIPGNDRRPAGEEGGFREQLPNVPQENSHRKRFLAAGTAIINGKSGTIEEYNKELPAEQKIAAIGDRNQAAGLAGYPLPERLLTIKPQPLTGSQIEKIKPRFIGTPLRHQFYAGIIAGPQLNQVMNQGFTKIGFSAGIMVGFRISNRVAVETGVLVAHKKYFTDGDHFSMSKVASTMPAGMHVESLTASSRFLEIPVKLKYDFYKKQNSNFFWTGGFCSYVLTEERNNYKARVNGNSENFKGYYKANNNYLSSSVQFSAGYEYKTGKKTTLRIEPYIQVPLKGMGIGLVPLQTTGIILGITIP